MVVKKNKQRKIKIKNKGKKESKIKEINKINKKLTYGNKKKLESDHLNK